jgi:plastocyanin
MPRPFRVFASLALLPGALMAQGSLDRSPNISGDWVVRPGTVQFNFVHRFIVSDAPARKVSNFPTFLLATSFVRNTTLGFNYATNSTLTPAYPNEWEFFLRARPLAQAKGFPIDVGGEIGWNVAADGPDGELSLARTIGPVKLTGVGRALTDPYDPDGGVQFAIGGGATLKVSRHLALVGDVASMTEKNSAVGEETAWSAGVAIAIPTTPHTLSLHATNTNTATLQGASRGADQVRYGFEFTIPITLSRYFGKKPAQTPAAQPTGNAPLPAAPGHVAEGQVTGVVFRTGMRDLQYVERSIEIAVGTTIEWTNNDPVPHTVTADDGSFGSPLINTGEVWRYTFTRPGSYAFHCTPHPFMTGTIVVK